MDHQEEEDDAPCAVEKASLNPAQDSIPSLDSSDSSLSQEEDSIGSIPLDCVLSSDEEIIESIHENLLRIIVTLQIEAAAAEIWSFEGGGGCKTPPSRHQGTKLVPDTCPGAPMKLTKISRNIDSGLRRKLF